MKQAMKDEIYRIFDRLIAAIKSEGADNLSVYGISPAIYDEITEELARSGEDVEGLRVPPHNIAFQADSTGQIPFDIVESNVGKDIGRVYCRLWNVDGESELTMVADVNQDSNNLTLIFRLLETQ